LFQESRQRIPIISCLFPDVSHVVPVGLAHGFHSDRVCELTRNIQSERVLSVYLNIIHVIVFVVLILFKLSISLRKRLILLLVKVFLIFLGVKSIRTVIVIAMAITFKIIHWLFFLIAIHRIILACVVILLSISKRKWILNSLLLLCLFYYIYHLILTHRFFIKGWVTNNRLIVLVLYVYLECWNFWGFATALRILQTLSRWVNFWWNLIWLNLIVFAIELVTFDIFGYEISLNWLFLLDIIGFYSFESVLKVKTITLWKDIIAF